MSFLSEPHRDALVQNASVRSAIAWLQWFTAPRTKRANDQRLKAFQLSESPRLWRRWQDHYSQAWNDRPQSLSPGDWPRYSSKLAADRSLNRSLLLKPPGRANERGVLLIQFEYNWLRLLTQIHDLASFTNHYQILWGTSWSPTDYRLLRAILERLPGQVCVLASNLSERAKLAAFDPRIRCPDVLSASDWLDPACFNPKPHSSRTIDVLMVANWAPFKRHFDLFKALPELPKDLRIVLIGQKEGSHTRDAILQLARRLKVPQRLEVYESLPSSQVRELQCDSKTSLILSLREGSCVAATEALMANCPLGMHDRAHVGSLAHINAQTGVRFSRKALAPQLAAFIANSSVFTPRTWASQNVSCWTSLEKLNAFCKQVELEAGRPWTQSLQAFRWNPYPEWVGSPVSNCNAALSSLAQSFPELFSAMERTTTESVRLKRGFATECSELDDTGLF